MSKSSKDRLIRRLTKRAEAKKQKPKVRCPCGPCTACCTELGVYSEASPGRIAMAKPAGVRCEYLTETGCSVYDKRPQACRDYACAYAFGLLNVPRPDDCDCIIDIGPARVRNNDGSERDVPNAVHFRPLDPDALTRIPLICERLSKSHICIVTHHAEIVGMMVNNEYAPVGDSTKKETKAS